MPIRRNLLFEELLDQAIASKEIQRRLEETQSISADVLRTRCLRKKPAVWRGLRVEADRFDDVCERFEKVGRFGWARTACWGLITSARGLLVTLVLGLMAITVGFLRAEPGRTGFQVLHGSLATAMFLLTLALLGAVFTGVTFTGVPSNRASLARLLARFNPFIVLAVCVVFFYVGSLELLFGEQAKAAQGRDEALWLATASAFIGITGLIPLLISAYRRGMRRADFVASSTLVVIVAGVPLGLFLISQADSAAAYTATPDWVWTMLGSSLVGAAALMAMVGLGKHPLAQIRDTYQQSVADMSATLSQDHILPFLRAEIADHVDDYAVHIDVPDAPGISQVFDTVYRVPTEAARTVAALVKDMPGGSIGLAGSRGSGKTTLMESYCAESSAESVLATMVAAPVEYSARDFLLHLYTKVCLEVLRDEPDAMHRDRRRIAQQRRRRAVGGIAGSALLYAGGVALLSFSQYVQKITATQWLAVAMIALSLVVLIYSGAGFFWKSVRARQNAGSPLKSHAAERLEQIRFQQSFTSTSTGTVKLPIGLEGALSRARGLTRQPMQLPEIVDSLRGLLALAAREHDQVVIGIDELDKMKSETAAEQFLNEIKGIFGIERVYFLVSVSEEAMSTFERRGLPFRDVFDSTFDEIVWFDHLTAGEAIDTINRRVLMPIPFKQLCYTLSAGLPRDLIRVVRTTLQHQDTPSPTALSVMAHRLVQEDVRRKSRAVAVAARRLDAEPLLSSFLAACGEVAELTVDVDALCGLIESVVPDRTGPDDATTRRLRRLISELAGFYYYSATLLEFFDDHAPDSRWQEATVPQTPGRAIDKLAVARQAFSASPLVAWQAVSRFREAWDMKTLDFPQGLVPEPAGAG